MLNHQNPANHRKNTLLRIIAKAPFFEFTPIFFELFIGHEVFIESASGFAH